MQENPLVGIYEFACFALLLYYMHPFHMTVLIFFVSNCQGPLDYVWICTVRTHMCLILQDNGATELSGKFFKLAMLIF